MSDDRRRELERRYRASGNPQDWAEWALARRRAGELGQEADAVIERIASGELSRERVALAGYLGDPVALALDEHEVIRLASYLSADLEIVPVVLGEPEAGDLEAWVRGLAHWDPSWCVLALIAVAERLREGMPDGLSEVEDLEYYRRLTDRALGAARDCLADPESDAKRSVALEHAHAWGAEHVPAVRAAVAAAEAAAGAAGRPSPTPEPGPWVELVVQTPAVAEWIRLALVPQALGLA